MLNPARAFFRNRPYGFAFHSPADLHAMKTIAAQLHDIDAKYILLTVNKNLRECRNFSHILAPYAIPLILRVSDFPPDVLRQWAESMGDAVAGWRIDGAKPENARIFSEILRAENPDALISFSSGMTYPPQSTFPALENMTPGEVADPFYALCPPVLPESIQYHVLSCAGTASGTGPLRFTPAELVMFTRSVNDNGGVFTWDIPFCSSGIESNVFDDLRQFARLYRDSLAHFPPVSVRIQSPFFDEAGVPHNGKAECTASAPGVHIRASWNGISTFSAGKSCWTIQLPALKVRESVLRLSCNSLFRDFPVPILRHILLKNSFTGRILLKNDEGLLLSEYLLAASDKSLKIHARLYEKSPIVRNPPQSGSCLELFFAVNENSPVHFLLRPDGAAFSMESGDLMPVPEIHAERHDMLDDRFYELHVDFPLKMLPEFVDSFRMTIRQTVNTPNGLKSGVLFGCPVSGESSLLGYASVRIAANKNHRD